MGDTFVYGKEAPTRREREERGLQDLLAEVSEATAARIDSAWREYEYEQSPEGRFVMAVDVLLPIFMNLAAGEQSSWSRHGVAAEAVRERVAKVHSAIPALADLAMNAIDEGVARGLLR